jgi:hypothetical protein
VAEVLPPHSLVLVAVLVELNAEAVLAVILPVSNIARSLLPLLALDAAVLLSLLFLNKQVVSSYSKHLLKATLTQ